MARYTLIASRDLFESREAAHYCELAGELREAGNDVTLFLVQNGVLGARESNVSGALSRLAQNGVKVLADAFSLRQRGIAEERLAAGIKPAELEIVVDQMAAGAKVVWH